MLKLRLKFIYKDQGKSRLVMTFAAPPFQGGPWKSNTTMYTEDGEFELSKIAQPVEETLEEA